MISQTLALDERISLITTIFSDSNQVEVVGQLSGDEAQSFIDIIDEVIFHTTSCSEDKAIDLGFNLHILSIRD